MHHRHGYDVDEISPKWKFPNSFLEGRSTCERILGSLEQTKPLLLGRRLPSLADRMKGWTEAEIRRLLKRAPFIRRTTTDSTDYQQHIFPAVSYSQVKAYLRRFSALLDRFQDVHIEDLGESIFALSRQ